MPPGGASLENSVCVTSHAGVRRLAEGWYHYDDLGEGPIFEAGGTAPIPVLAGTDLPDHISCMLFQRQAPPANNVDGEVIH